MLCIKFEVSTMFWSVKCGAGAEAGAAVGEGKWSTEINLNPYLVLVCDLMCPTKPILYYWHDKRGKLCYRLKKAKSGF